MTLTAQMVQDLDAFFDASTGFAVAASLVLGGGAPVDVAVIFDNPYAETDPVTAVGIATSQPTARVRAADAPGVAEGDTLTIDGTVYTVISPPRPDGIGVTLLTLAA